MSKRKTVKTKPRKHASHVKHKFHEPLEAAIASLVELAKARAARKRVPFDLTDSDVARLAVSRICPITGLPFVVGAVKGSSRPHPLAPSLDRVIAHLGYTKGNVRLVCWWANGARNSLSDEQFGIMVEAAHRTRQSAILQ